MKSTVIIITFTALISFSSHAQVVKFRQLQDQEGGVYYYNNIPYTGETFQDSLHFYKGGGVRYMSRMKFKDGLMVYAYSRDYKADSILSETESRYRHLFRFDTLLTIEPEVQFQQIELMEFRTTTQKGIQFDFRIQLLPGTPKPKDPEKLVRDVYQLLQEKKILNIKKYRQVTGYLVQYAPRSQAFNTLRFIPLYEKNPKDVKDEDDVKFEIMTD